MLQPVSMSALSQVWSQWEEDSAWSDSLLRPLQTSFPRMQQEGASEAQISEKLSVYKVRAQAAHQGAAAGVSSVLVQTQLDN